MRRRCILAAMALLALFMQVTEGTVWTVGDSKGWQLSVDYEQWTSGKVFDVGDSLLFIYNTSSENVLEVSEADYASCTTVNPIVTYTGGNTSVPLTNYTTLFFISGFPGHCLAGMTLQILVGSLPPTPAPAPSPSPVPVSASSSPPSPSSTNISPVLPPVSQQALPPPPSPPNSAPSSGGKALRIAGLLAIYVGAGLIL